MSSVDKIDELSKQVLDERSRRPGGSGTICQRCCYWECTKYDTAQLAKDNSEQGGAWSDIFGFCKRHAPIPVQAITHHMGQLLGEIALMLHGAHNYELTKNRDYHLEGRDTFEVNEWPMTNANDWCGDFKAAD